MRFFFYIHKYNNFYKIVFIANKNAPSIFFLFPCFSNKFLRSNKSMSMTEFQDCRATFFVVRINLCIKDVLDRLENIT